MLLNYFAGFGIVGIALLTAYVTGKVFPSNDVPARFSSIDGLRGYLAFFVFLHHSSIWYFYLQSNKWEVPPSNLFIHFGQSSVAVFFMITGFLFFTKLFDAKNHGISWRKLFISRIFRIAPLYFFTVTLLFAIVAILSEGQINEPLPEIFHEVLCWMAFTAFGAPDINAIPNTLVITAGVTWSIVYEWIFYLLLPLVAIMFGMRPSIKAWLFGVLGLAIAISMHAKPGFLGIFLSGFAAAALVRSNQFCRIARHKLASFIVIACVVTVVACFDTAYRFVPVLLLTIAFSFIAGGNDLFGLLNKTVSIALGKLSYSIYLLHGIILFIAIRLILASHDLQALTMTEYWLLIAAISPTLIICATLSFHYIEQPCMRFGQRIMQVTKIFFESKKSVHSLPTQIVNISLKSMQR